MSFKIVKSSVKIFCRTWNLPLISPPPTTWWTAGSGARDTLWHDCTAWGTSRNFGLLPPLDFLHPHLPFDELIDVCNHDWALDVHECE